MDKEPLVGTWLNQEPGRVTKNIFTPDGKALYYYNAANEEPDLEARYTIEEKWTDRYFVRQDPELLNLWRGQRTSA